MSEQAITVSTAIEPLYQVTEYTKGVSGWFESGQYTTAYPERDIPFYSPLYSRPHQVVIDLVHD